MHKQSLQKKLRLQKKKGGRGASAPAAEAPLTHTHSHTAAALALLPSAMEHPVCRLRLTQPQDREKIRTREAIENLQLIFGPYLFMARIRCGAARAGARSRAILQTMCVLNSKFKRCVF